MKALQPCFLSDHFKVTFKWHPYEVKEFGTGIGAISPNDFDGLDP